MKIETKVKIMHTMLRFTIILTTLHNLPIPEFIEPYESLMNLIEFPLKLNACLQSWTDTIERN